MDKTFSKKINQKEIDTIHYYIKNFEINSKNKLVKKIYRTKNYIVQIFINNTILVQGKNFDWILNVLKSNNKIEKNLKENSKIKKYIGTDESGTGDFFGGICVSAAYVDDKNKNELIELGVRDSKKMKDNYILKIVEKVKKLSDFEIFCINPTKYNELYKTHKNIKKIIALMHINVINAMQKKLEIKNIIIDQFVEEKTFFKYLFEMNISTNLNIEFYTKAESKFFNVAVASIISREAFLKQIQNLEKDEKVFIPLGAVSSVVVPAGNKFLTRDNLNKFIKINFKTVEKINFK